ncbi:hypothetical protein V3C99_006480 [Haemonchus contortus]
MHFEGRPVAHFEFPIWKECKWIAICWISLRRISFKEEIRSLWHFHMRTVLSVSLCLLLYESMAISTRTKRATSNNVPWHGSVELQRIFQAGNRRALDIETFTKQAAVKQNEQNALLASSRSVLSPMAAMAVESNRFSPPDIVVELKPDRAQDFVTKINGDHVLTDRNTLLGNEIVASNFPMRDVPPPAPPPTRVLPALPPAMPPPSMILPRLLQPPRLGSGGIGVVETPWTVDEEATRIYARNLGRFEEPRSVRDKLPMRGESNSLDPYENWH